MKVKELLFRYFWIFAAGAVFTVGACTTTEVSPLPELPPSPPSYSKVPHPLAYDMGDIIAIFTEKDAPTLESLASCDADFIKFKSMTNNPEDIRQGARELIRQDPVKYHWCFYGKILTLDEQLKKDVYLDERQKDVLDAFSFLTPIARAYQLEFQDSRYLRWAIHRYRRLSEWVFYRKLELTPEITSELVVATNPFHLWREPAEAKKTMLEKYGFISPSPSPSPLPQTVEPKNVIEGVEPSPVPSVSPEPGN